VVSSCVRVNEVVKNSSQSLEVFPSDMNKVRDGCECGSVIEFMSE
jgi:hypothetical protein